MFKSWNCISIILTALIAGSLPACTPGSTSVPTPAEGDLLSDEQAVYAAVFAELYGEPQMYVLTAESAPGMEGVEALDAIMERMTSEMTGLEEESAANYRLRNATATLLPADMDLGLPYSLLTKTAFDEIFALNTSGWDVFYTRFPNSPGMTTVSRVGFNNDLTQALVYVGTISHWLAGAGTYLLLKKTDGVWQISQQMMAWIS